ncbi:Metalloenzyme, LuxS/M16 peptidase-like protein [Haematococcus lacustris]
MLGSIGAIAAAAMPALTRGVYTSSVSAAAVPALISSTSSTSGGLFAALGFGKTRIDTPLSEPLPSALLPGRSSLPTVAPELATGSLVSGTRVTAIDTPGPVSTIAVAFEAGSAYETDATLGASRVLEQMAFKATTHRTTFRLTRELEKIGATVTAKAGRDHIVYAVSAVKMHTPEVVEMLMDATLNPRLTYWEVKEALITVKEQLRDAAKQPALVVTDVLHRAAYEGSLGQPLYPDASMVSGVSNDMLHSYLSSTFAAGHSVVAAAGVGLDEFTELANPMMTDEPGPAPSAKYSSGYLGSSLNVISPTSPVVYAALAFESKGGLSDPKGAAAAAVVKQLLDESRAVLPRTYRESEVYKSAAGFSHQYKDSGLVGMLASTAPAQLSQLVDAVCKKMEGLAKGVSEAQLKQAKQLAIGAYANQLASTVGMAKLMGPQLLLTGKFVPGDFAASVEALTAAEVAAYVSKALKSTPTYVTYGSLSCRVPRYDQILKRFG